MKYFLSLSVLLLASGLTTPALDLKPTDKVAVLSGQSFEGWSWAPSGYLRLVSDELTKAGLNSQPSIDFENIKTSEMVQHIDADVIAKAPAYVLLIPGMADYNPWTQAAVDDSYKANLETVIGKLQAANIKTVLVVAYASNSNLAFATNKNIGPHNDVVRALAQEHNLPLIDLMQLIDNAPKTVPFDGNPVAKCLVHQILAAEILKTMGETDAEVAALKQAWFDKPGAVQIKPCLSINQYEKIKAAAKAAGKDPADLMAEILHKSVNP
jgi:lysophospholipase L1-like esterase